ncbi:MAG: diguanylate cyclase [Gaiellaceae bacterium]
MSTVAARPSEASAPGVGSPLPLGATLYLALVGAGALGLGLPMLGRLSFDTPDWTTCLLLSAGAAVAQIFTVRTTRNYSYHTTGVFLVPAALLLPGGLVALMPLAQRLPDWLRRRTPWTIQSFNVFNYTLAVLAAWGGARFVRDALPEGAATLALAGCLAAVAFVTVQALLAAPMLCLARRCSLRETGVFTFHGVSTELVLAALGVGVAFLWQENPWLVPFALAPLLIVHRSLSVPLLEAEARVDAKTGLFNARHFTSALENEFARAKRFGRPLSVVMADLDLLREVNNTYGHLAGDAVLRAVADVFRSQLRHYDVAARFGGEEFALVLPETGTEEAAEIAERIRRAVAAQAVTVPTSDEPIRATISMGLATYPTDGCDATELVHQADVAVYRAKLQGRNRVVHTGGEPVRRRPRSPAAEARAPEAEGRSRQVSPLVLWLAGSAGVAGGLAGVLFGAGGDLPGMLALVGIVALVQALAEDGAEEAASANAVGILAGAALFGPRVALAAALAACAVEWSRTRKPPAQAVFELGSLTVAALATTALFALRPGAFGDELETIVAGLVGGAVYFGVTAGPRLAGLTISRAQERHSWRLLQQVAGGLLAGIVAVAYGEAGVWTLALLVVPLLLARSMQERHAGETRRTAERLGETLEAVRAQNAALEEANLVLKEHSTAVMEALATSVDARQAVGHSRDVQRLALAIGARLRLSRPELDLLAHAALFHDIGKLAVPDAVLLKPTALTDDEWKLMRPHAHEGARLVQRLAFLEDAVPSIRHHHEHFDGSGYPDGLRGEDIPLGARIIHVADAVVSMLDDRTYEARRSPREVLTEVRRCSGTQFCPRCVDALQDIAAEGLLEGVRRPLRGPRADALAS